MVLQGQAFAGPCSPFTSYSRGRRPLWCMLSVAVIRGAPGAWSGSPLTDGRRCLRIPAPRWSSS